MPPRTRSTARLILAGVLVAAFVATLIALAVLWPTGPAPTPGPGFKQSQSMAADAVNGTVIDHRQGPCSSPDVGRVFEGEPRPATPQPVPLGTIADEPAEEDAPGEDSAEKVDDKAAATKKAPTKDDKSE